MSRKTGSRRAAAAVRPAWRPPMPDPATGGSGSAWLVTFTDLVALLLAFFVMLFAMMTLDKEVWQSLQEGFAVEWVRLEPLPQPPEPTEEHDAPTVELQAGIDLDYLAVLMRRELPQHPALAGARIDRQEGRLVVALPDRLLFESGATRPHPAAADALYTLGGLLRHLDNRIEVLGYADPRPMPEGETRSNWELSLARGAAVADMLARAGYAQPILIRGHGESRYDELSPALGADRLALGRRTDIVILDDAGEGPP